MKLSELRNLLGSYAGNPNDQEARNAHIRALGYEPGEIYQELEMESELVDTHRDVSFANAHVNLHSHSFYELLYCINDCGAEYLVGTKRYRLQKGDIIFVPPGISHRPLLPEHMEQPYMRYVLWLSHEFLSQYAHLLSGEMERRDDYVGMFRPAAGQWDSIGEAFRKGVEETEHKELDWQAAVVGNTITLLTQLHRAIRENSARPMRAEKPELLDRAMAYIEGHLADKISLGEVARHFYVSESTISQTFRKKMGVSFYHCVNQRRLISAKTLIQKGIPLEEVGQMVGFSDYSTFYRAFKKEYGISPRQFRKMQNTTE